MLSLTILLGRPGQATREALDRKSWRKNGGEKGSRYASRHWLGRSRFNVRISTGPTVQVQKPTHSSLSSFTYVTALICATRHRHRLLSYTKARGWGASWDILAHGVHELGQNFDLRNLYNNSPSLCFKPLEAVLDRLVGRMCTHIHDNF